MGVRKSQVFVVSGRKKAEGGAICGPVVQMVACSDDDASVRELLAEQAPGFEVLSCMSLAALEATAKHVRDVLGGTAQDWPLLIDPALLEGRKAA